MKIIDLLNKIANGEELPKKIKYNDKIYIAKGNAIEHFVDYCSDEDEWCFNHYVRYENLNAQVEIIEEEKKIPEKIDYLGLNIREGNLSKKDTIMLCDYIDYQTQIINQLIDYLKSKGE